MKKKFNQLIGAKEILQFECEDNTKVSIKSYTKESGFFLVNYYVNQKFETEKIINIGFVEIETIKIKEIKNFKIEQNAFTDKVKILLHIKAQNCAINILGLNEEITIYSDEPNFFFVIFDKSQDYKFSITLLHFDDIEKYKRK